MKGEMENVERSQIVYRSYLNLACRIHETVAERDRHGRVLDHDGDGPAVDMLMSLIDHLDLGAIMQHLGDEARAP